MPNLAFNDFIICFKKQFLLQKGRGGRRTSPYYTNYNQQQKLKTDLWGIMVFIHAGTTYGFTDEQMQKELKISKSLYEELKEVTPAIVRHRHPDKILCQKVTVKIQLIKNVVRVNCAC